MSVLISLLRKGAPPYNSNIITKIHGEFFTSKIKFFCFIVNYFAEINESIKTLNYFWIFTIL